MMFRALLAASIVQWHTSRRAPEHLVILAVAPLFSLILLSIVQRSGRPDLIVNAVVGTGLLGIWFVAVNVAGGVIQNDRWMSTLELVLVAPTPLGVVMCGRILPVMGIGGLTLAESWLVARLLFGLDVGIRSPVLAFGALVLTLLASACTATMLAALFVLTRNTEVLQSTMSYPFYVIGGLVFPLSMLPGWVEPISRLFYLSWSAELMRDAVLSEVVPHAAERLLVIGGLSVIALGVGILLIRKAADRARRTGMVSLA